MDSDILHKRVCVIMTGFSCNNNCVVCSVKPFSLNHRDNETEAIVELMERKRDAGARSIEFTGGEPTIRKDIIFLINKARELGYGEIALSTNARSFSYEPFLKAALSGGLNRVTATMDGPTTVIHDAITRTPGSFLQTTKGVANLLDAGVEVSVNTVLCKLNAPYIKEMAEKLIEMGVPVWGILDLIPDGNISLAYDSFCLSFADVRSSLREAYLHIDKFRLIELFDFSVCAIPREMLSDDRVVFFDAFSRSNFLDQVGYNPERFTEKSGIYDDEHKTRIGGCLECRRGDKCAGVWTRHLGVFKEEDERFVAENGFSSDSFN